jgi:haloalkane dehalogenase
MNNSVNVIKRRMELKTIQVFNSTMSYVESGEGDPIVLLHGNPTSSYLWRNIIPYLDPYGRCLAPDLIGMGQSGESSDGSYRFLDHVRYLDEWFEQMELAKNVTLVLHDWGSALGFYWAFRNRDKIKAIVYMEAIVQPRIWSDFPGGRDKIFRALNSEAGEQMVYEQNFFVETVLPKSILRTLSDEEMDAYRSPFKMKERRKPTLDLARDLPIEGQPAEVANIVAQYGEWLSHSDIPKLLIVAQPGALLHGRNLAFARTWGNQKEVTVKGIHYIQEDSPNEIGEAVREFYLTVEGLRGT